MDKVVWWPEPTAGNIVWCHFPDRISPKAKPRPALILTVFDDGGEFCVKVAYGTSRKILDLHRSEFAIRRDLNAEAFRAAGLSFDTKFDLKQMLDLPYNSAWFSIPPGAPHGQNPKLGILHACMMRHLQAAVSGLSGA